MFSPAGVSPGVMEWRLAPAVRPYLDPDFAGSLLSWEEPLEEEGDFFSPADCLPSSDFEAPVDVLGRGPRESLT